VNRVAGFPAKWTILTYIAAHNNLDELGRRSLGQILGVGSTPEVKLLVLYDGQESASRFLAGGPGKAASEYPLKNFDSGDGGALLETARWAFQQCPAERYGLILWSHGSGWRPEEIENVAKQARGDARVDAVESHDRAAAPGSMALFRSTLTTILKKDKPAERAVCFDDGSGHSLDTLELDRVAREIRAMLGRPLDFLGMDACLMATLEVAYQVRESVRYLVASEELVPGSSWPYDRIFGELRGDPGRSPADLAKSVVKRYMEYYREHPPSAGDVTKAALDLGQVSQIARAVDCLAGALTEDMDTQGDLLWKAQLDCYEQESRKRKREPNKFRFHLWDLGSLSVRLAGAGSSQAVREAAQSLGAALKPGGPAVLAEEHLGEWFEGIGGVSIYLVPAKRQRVSPYYADLALAKDTKWAAMLQAYHDYFG
jgi:Clostripain family